MSSDLRYTFPAIVDRVKDGDTIVATITVAHAEAFHEIFDVKQQRVWRLNGCNARESRDPTGGGRAATEHLKALLPVGTPVTIHSIKVDPYTDGQTEAARYEASITMPDGTDLVERLIADGWVARWDGTSQPRPLPPWPRPATT